MDGDCCQSCQWQTWRIIFPGPNGLCVWDTCLYCGTWVRVWE